MLFIFHRARIAALGKSLYQVSAAGWYAHLGRVFEGGELVVREIQNAKAVEAAQFPQSYRRSERVVAQIEPLQLLHADEQRTLEAAELVVLESHVLDARARGLFALLLDQVLQYHQGGKDRSLEI